MAGNTDIIRTGTGSVRYASEDSPSVAPGASSALAQTPLIGTPPRSPNATAPGRGLQIADWFERSDRQARWAAVLEPTPAEGPFSALDELLESPSEATSFRTAKERQPRHTVAPDAGAASEEHLRLAKLARAVPQLHEDPARQAALLLEIGTLALERGDDRDESQATRGIGHVLCEIAESTPSPDPTGQIGPFLLAHAERTDPHSRAYLIGCVIADARMLPNQQAAAKQFDACLRAFGQAQDDGWRGIPFEHVASVLGRLDMFASHEAALPTFDRLAALYRRAEPAPLSRRGDSRPRHPLQRLLPDVGWAAEAVAATRTIIENRPESWARQSALMTLLRSTQPRMTRNEAIDALDLQLRVMENMPKPRTDQTSDDASAYSFSSTPLDHDADDAGFAISDLRVVAERLAAWSLYGRIDTLKAHVLHDIPQ